MKTSKRIVSLLLTASMILSCFAVAIPFFKLEASAAETITINGVTQERVVGTDGSYKTTYANYAAQYLNGASFPTDIVIPGLNAAQDYVIQGMTYYPARDWMLVTAYHNVADGETTQSSKVFALDAKTGKFVAMFSFLNTDGSENTDHGGGIAVSEHNIYYSCGDKDRKIAYAPLSALANAPEGAHTKIQLVAEKDFVEIGSIDHDGKTAYSAYVSYDQGVLWVGNFYDVGADLIGITIAAAEYNAPSNNTYNSMVFGYKLEGNSSAEEWDYLMGKFKNLASITAGSGTATSEGGTLTWSSYNNNGSINIIGNITAPTADVDEFSANFGGNFQLTEGVNYTIEFTSTNNLTDIYLFAPNGAHTNVKQSSQTKITELEDGRYHYSMDFTAGLRPAGADSSWPTTQSTDKSYTGNYTIRFDQDAIQAGEAREFAITNIKISQKNPHANAESVYGEGFVGSPSYAIALSNTLKDVQYATVDNGKLYLSRSYGSGAGNSINFGFGDCSYLTVADIDLSVPGDTPVKISTTGTGSLDKTVMAYEITDYKDYPMMPMSEGLCVIDGDIFITFEGASNKYLNESSGLTSIGNCEKPVDVIWQLDPYELMEIPVTEPEKSIYYERVDNLSEIKDGEEYIIVHESPEKDPVTQMPYLYALNAFGNFKGYNLSKSSVDAVKGYDGMIGHPISYYSIVEDGEKELLYLDNPEIDDIKSIRWTLTKGDGNKYRITSTDPYYANCNCLYVDEDHITMMPSNYKNINNMSFQEATDGESFWIANSDQYFLWCNEGEYTNIINKHYITNSSNTPIYSGLSEQPGTFHCDAMNIDGNILGKPINNGPDTHYRERLFKIYRRVVDEVASTYESRVYTDLKASLQADGTYTVELQTYAISPNHYQYVGERPTDYIIVADTSSSMASAGSTGIQEFNRDLKVQSLSIDDNIADDNGKENSAGDTDVVIGYAYSNENIYFKHTDGKYYKALMAIRNTFSITNLWVTKVWSFKQQYYYLYYIADDGYYYCFTNQESTPSLKYTQAQFKAWVEGTNGTLQTASSTKSGKSDRKKEVLINGSHYRFDEPNGAFGQEHSRINTLKEVATDLVDNIAAQNSKNRIALVQYGADSSTGFYTTSGNFTQNDYANAFWSASAAGNLKTTISNLKTSAQTSNAGVEMSYADNLIANSGKNYTAEGDRNVAVILITDGIPGADSNSATATAANAVIAEAKKAKQAGAFVYTVLLGNNEVSGFDKKTYMDAVSSKYAAADSMNSLGGQSVDGVNYALNLASTTINNYLDFGEIACGEVARNNAVGLDNLNEDSYLREKLTDAFIFPEGWSKEKNLKTYYVKGDYDAIGRFSFGAEQETTEVNTNVDTATKTITVTNYDYSTHYISKGNEEGKALRVVITGLLADETKDISNTSINVKEKTGLYKTGAKMNADEEFRLLPTEYFNIPTYNFTLDFGFPMLDTDVNGTLCAVSNGLTAQDPDNYNKATKDEMIQIEDGDQNLIYSLKSDTPNKTAYVLITRTEGEYATGEYDWFGINLIPASNIYYEQDGFKTGASGKVNWTNDGTPAQTYQDLSVAGTDTYGYDSNYANGQNAHSNGAAKKVTITKTNNKSAAQTFEFFGTGFDLVSACGAATGTLAVKVSKADGTLVKAYLVDTYCSDTSLTTGKDGLLCQVPIVSFASDSGTAEKYKVEVTAIYLSTSNALKPVASSVTETVPAGELEATTAVVEDNSAIYDELAALGMNDIANADLELVWFDDNSILNGGTGANGKVDDIEMAGDSTVTELNCYLDGFRIYHPLNTDYTGYIPSEQGATYINVLNNISNIYSDSELGDETIFSSFAYIVEKPKSEDGTDDVTFTFGNYKEKGPQNELYLKGKNGETLPAAVAFNVQRQGPNGEVHLGLRAVTGTAKVKVSSGEKAVTFDVNSATEMYYDITEFITTDSTGVANITIQNVGTGVLAVNNIKLTGDATATGLSEDDLSTFSIALNATAEEAVVDNGKVTVEKPEEPTTPGVDAPTEKTFFEILIDFVKNLFDKILAFLTNVLAKGGNF